MEVPISEQVKTYNTGFGKPKAPVLSAIEEDIGIAQAANPTDKPARDLKPYRSSWRDKDEPSLYDPEYFDIEEDTLVSDTGEIVGRKDKLVPKPHAVLRLPAEKQEGMMYRGMSGDEMKSILETGKVKSKGEYNFTGGQEGLTYFDINPASAESYASSFAPAQHKPTFDRPAYVIGMKQPGPEQIRTIPGTSEAERGIMGELSAEDILNVWRGNVIERNPGYRSPSGNITVSPSTRLHWEELPGGLNALREQPSGGVMSELDQPPGGVMDEIAQAYDPGDAPKPKKLTKPEREAAELLGLSQEARGLFDMSATPHVPQTQIPRRPLQRRPAAYP